MKEILSTPYLGIVLSLIAFETGLFIYRKTKFPLFNPLLIAIVIVIAFLATTGTSLETYNKGGAYISIFLGPATVILAVPLFKQIDKLKANIIPILSGIVTGCITALASVYFLGKLFNLKKEIIMSMLPKSITTPIGIELSRQLGGIPALTVAAIVVTGILGAVVGPAICKICGIRDKVAVGVAIGTSAHALGTTKAIELGEVEGAMSGLSIGVAGLVTVIISTVLIRFI